MVNTKASGSSKKWDCFGEKGTRKLGDVSLAPVAHDGDLAACMDATCPVNLSHHEDIAARFYGFDVFSGDEQVVRLQFTLIDVSRQMSTSHVMRWATKSDMPHKLSPALNLFNSLALVCNGSSAVQAGSYIVVEAFEVERNWRGAGIGKRAMNLVAKAMQGDGAYIDKHAVENVQGIIVSPRALIDERSVSWARNMLSQWESQGHIHDYFGVFTFH